jgi:hypothetical protein
MKETPITVYTADKYNDFYQSIKDLALKLNLSMYNDFEGASEKEISEFENRFKIRFPLSIKSFLKYFGSRIAIKNTDIGLNLTLRNIEEATKIAINNNVSEFLIQNEKLVDFIDDSIVTNINDFIEVKSIIYISWDDSRSGLTFINSSKENPEIYYLMEYKFFINEMSMSFTNHIRFYIFQAIRTLLKSNNYEIQNVYNLENLAWINIYNKIFQSKQNGFVDMYNERMKFNLEVSNLEIKENIILSIDEFENKFINYLVKKGYKI